MKNFSLVRYVTIGSILFFIIAMGVLTVLLKQNSEANLLHMAQQNNYRLSNLLAKTVEEELTFMFANPTLTYDKHPDFKTFYAGVQKNMDGLQVLKVKIFTPIGLTVFSTQLDQMGADKSTNAGFLSALNGVPTSELSHRDTFSAFEQEVSNLDVISSYIPIYLDGAKTPSGVFEVYSDVTPLLAMYKNEQYYTLALTSSIFLLLWSGLFFVIRSADKKINSQIEENQKAKLHMAQSEKMASLGEMVAAVSHELNTPIAFVQSNLNILSDAIGDLIEPSKLGANLAEMCHKTDKDIIRLAMNAASIRQKTSADGLDFEADEFKELLGQSLAGMVQMSELVRNLKDFTRIDRNRSADFNINKGLDNVHYIVRSVIPENVVITKVLGDIPLIPCMASQINQVFLNLIQNAAHAGATEIELATFTEGTNVCITVTDNGSGIPADVLPQIFESFFTTKERTEGSGLGLYISKEIIENHGGELRVSSTVGHGTIFSVVLPIETPANLKQVA